MVKEEWLETLLGGGICVFSQQIGENGANVVTQVIVSLELNVSRLTGTWWRRWQGLFLSEGMVVGRSWASFAL